MKMFLEKLNRQQKKLFMDLAIKAAEANGVVEYKEKRMLDFFAMEMQIETKYSTDLDVEYIIKELVKISSASVLRIITLEILAIMISDNEFDAQEENFINNMIQKFNISKNVEEQILETLTGYVGLYNKLKELIIEPG